MPLTAATKTQGPQPSSASKPKLPGQESARGVTLEMLLWVGVGCLALALRVAGLGQAPLSAAEAQEAMAAWDAVQAGVRTASGYTPLLFVFNSALFAVGGASDALARVGPALCGTVLVLSPLAFRRQLGRLAALIAGAVLALSPAAMVASRQVDGTVFAVTGATLAVAEFLRYRAVGHQRHLVTAAVAAAVALSTGGDAITPFVSIFLAGAIAVLIWPVALERGWLGRLRRDLQPAWWALAGVLTALVAGLGWHPAGLGALGESLARWPARFRLDGGTLVSPLGLLALYEPLPLLFGVGGLVCAARRGSRVGVLLGLWAAAQLAVLALSPAGHPLDVLGCVVPLACLAGVAVAAVLEAVTNPQDWPAVRLYLPVVIVLWVYVYLMLMRYANTANASDLLLAFLAGLMQALLAALFALATHPGRAAIAFAAATGLVLLAVTVSAGWGVAFVRASDPREPLLAQPTAEEVRDLRHTLREISWAETGLPSTLRLALEEPSSPVLRWYLRDFADLESYVPGSGAELPTVLVTARRELLLPGARYVGQDFPLARRWDPRTVGCAWTWPPHCEAAVRWWLLRRTPELPEVSQWAVVWVQASDGE